MAEFMKSKPQSLSIYVLAGKNDVKTAIGMNISALFQRMD